MALRPALLLIVALGCTAGCVAPASPSGSTHDGLAFSLPRYDQPALSAFHVTADTPTECRGFVQLNVPPMHGLAAAAYGNGYDLQVDTDLAVGARAGTQQETVLGFLAWNSGFPVNVTVVGEQWMWFYAANTQPGSVEVLGKEITLPAARVDLRCPGAIVQMLVGSHAVPLHWEDGGDAAVALLGDDAWIAAQPMGGPFTDAHVFLGIAPAFAGTEAKVIVSSPAGTRTVDVSSGNPEQPHSYSEQGGPGTYNVQIVSRGAQPAGVLFGANPVDAPTWVAEHGGSLASPSGHAQL